MLMIPLPAATDPASFLQYVLFLFMACFAGFAATITPKRKNKSRDTESIRKISSMINQSLDLNTILESALEEITGSLGMSAGVIRLRAENGSSYTTFIRGFSKENTGILEGIREEGIASYPLPFVSSEVSKWGDSILAGTLRREVL